MFELYSGSEGAQPRNSEHGVVKLAIQSLHYGFQAVACKRGQHEALLQRHDTRLKYADNLLAHVGAVRVIYIAAAALHSRLNVIENHFDERSKLQADGVDPYAHGVFDDGLQALHQRNHAAVVAGCRGVAVKNVV